MRGGGGLGALRGRRDCNGERRGKTLTTFPEWLALVATTGDVPGVMIGAGIACEGVGGCASGGFDIKPGLFVSPRSVSKTGGPVKLSRPVKWALIETRYGAKVILSTTHLACGAPMPPAASSAVRADNSCCSSSMMTAQTGRDRRGELLIQKDGTRCG